MSATGFEEPGDRPHVRETPDAKSLHFASVDLQSRMLKADPVALTLDYTKSMMGFLLFVPRPQRLALIGLGGGSLAKFCYHELPDTEIDVVEINPDVVDLRDEFQVPRDDQRFRIHVDDGARFIANALQRYDVILLDGYTNEGIPASLASHKFHRDCRQALSESGLMVSNLHGPDVARHVDRICRTYRDQVVWLEETTCTNRTVFAFKCGTAHAPQTPRLDATLLESARLRALLPALFARCAELSWPTRKSVARL